MPKRTETQTPSTPHGFVRTVSVAKIGEAELIVTVSAAPADLAKIAAYLDLVSLEALSAEVHLSRARGKAVQLSGHFVADVTQACVVTLDPVAAHLEGDFERRFVAGAAASNEHEVDVDPDGDDPAEPLGREIDLAEIMVEELSLALDPYPRKAGVAFDPEQDTVAKRDNPFAVLSKLQAKAAKTKPKG